jgi:succinoglycan biosynthesis protein ExoM
MHIVNICVCTYNRNELLEKCLLSLYAMEIPPDTQVSVTVIDNHERQLARKIVDELSATSTLQTYYVHETKRGIPHARNQAITESYALKADYLAFIDDDEWVATDWLSKLYGYCMQRGGELVVSGVVISELPANVPEAIAPLLTNSRRLTTGTALTACATNNVIFPLAITRQLGLQFDASNPQAGGEDTVFFTKMDLQGIAIEHCAEAIVYEHIPPARTKLKWLAKRKFWAGTINAWRKQQQGRWWLSILISSALQVIAYSLLLIVLSLAGQSLPRNKALMKVSRAAGELAGLFGYRVDSY